jgi:trimethylamine corrinoid protein
MYEHGGESAAELSRRALGAGVSPLDIVDALSAGITELGKRFEDMSCFLPDLMLGGQMMKESMAILTPEIEKLKGAGSAIEPVRVVVGNLEGDIHDIGRDILVTMLNVSGVDVVNVGNNVKADAFIDKAEETGADVIGLSSLLTTSLPFAKDVIGLLEARGLRGKYRVMMGGGAVTREFADSIGADLYGRTAISAVDILRDAYPDRFQ